MTTWVDGAAGSLFDVDNLPYGVFSRAGEEPRVGVRIGDLVLDLAPVAAAEMLDVHHVFQEPTLNPLMAEGPQVRRVASGRGSPGCSTDETERDLVEPHLRPARRTSTLHLPVEVADYVDFYASLEHATNVGRIFRPDAEPLLPELAAPAGRLPRPRRHRRGQRHRRRPAVRASGSRRTPTRRRTARARGSTSRPSSASWSARRRPLGDRVAVDDFADHVFGVVGLNDWSARDIQAWEYVPLGPFLGKSFATSISHWVTPLAALDAAWVDLPGQDPDAAPLPAEGVAARGLDIDVEVELERRGRRAGRRTPRCTGRRPRCSPT